MLVESILDTIGDTPLVKLKKFETFGNEIYIKLDGFNPGRSTKDRIALAMIEEAEKEGKLDKNTIVLEATSGNTGISLAMVCAVKGYQLKIVMPDSMSIERRKMMEIYGAEVILTDGKKGMKGCLEKLNELKAKYKKVFVPNQFENINNPKIHYNQTAKEILKDMDNKIDIFIGGTGSGGSFTGIATRLKEELKNVKTYPVEPESSPLLSKGYTGEHKIQGMGMSLGVVPKIYNNNLSDEILTCKCNDAISTMKELALREGIFAGISTGAVIFTALEMAKKNSGKGLKIVALSVDSGEKYFSVI